MLFYFVRSKLFKFVFFFDRSYQLPIMANDIDRYNLKMEVNDVTI